MPGHKKAHTVCQALIVLLALFTFSSARGTPSQEELKKKYVPGQTPEATYRQELDMMAQGVYCYDLPIFDSRWRMKGKQVFPVPVPAQKYYGGFETFIDGERAVIYYPGDRSIGPVFLYYGRLGWVLDRSVVLENVHYSPDNAHWFVYDGDYRYLGMLKKIMDLKEGIAGGRRIFTPR